MTTQEKQQLITAFTTTLAPGQRQRSSILLNNLIQLINAISVDNQGVEDSLNIISSIVTLPLSQSVGRGRLYADQNFAFAISSQAIIGAYYIVSILTGSSGATITFPANSLLFDSPVYGTSPVLEPNGNYDIVARCYSENGVDKKFKFEIIKYVSSAIVLPPAAPVGLAASGLSSSSFTVSWSAVLGATYRVDLSTQSDFSTYVSGYQNVSVATNSFGFSGLSASTQYYCRVRAVNSGGTSSNSSTLPVLTSAPSVTPAPALSAFTSVRSNNFIANWGAVLGATGYRLDVSLLPDFSTFVSGFSNLAVAGTSRVITGLAANTTHYVRVRAEAATGTSANSASANTTTLQAPVAFGSLYSKPSGWTSGTITDFTTSGNINLALSGSDIVISGGSGAFTDFATFGAVNMFDDWEIVGTLEITEITSTSFGIGFGTVSQNPALKPSVLGRFSHADPPTIFGKAFVDTGLIGGTWTNRNAGGTTNFVVGDIITFEVNYVNAVVTAKIKRVGDPDTLATYAYPFPIPTSSGLFLPNMFKPGIYTFGGSIKLKTLTYSTNAYRRAKLACVGDSITQGYFASPVGNRFPSQLQTVYGGVNNFGSGSDTTAHILARLPQILSTQPQRILLQCGYNDLDQGVLPATTYANYDNICSQILAAGVDLWHLPIPSASPALDMIAMIGHITSTYPSGNVILTTPQLNVDGIHPTSVGMTTIAAAVQSAIGHLLV